MKIVTAEDIKNLYRSPKDSHKGQNGRLLVIGGSKLFHSSIFWAADVASRIVDLVHFSSPAMENNDLVRQKAKAGFWNGIVVPWEKVEEYIREDDCIVIGPGMVRFEESQSQKSKVKSQKLTDKSEMEQAAFIDDTRTIVNTLLKKYPSKKWVVDGGALQEVNPALIPSTAILTPHKREFEGLMKRSNLAIGQGSTLPENISLEDQIKILAKTLKCTILLKGVTDIVCSGGKCDPQICTPGECVEVEGGNEGMTKGGTGDVLAGLVGALYCKNEAMLAAMAGSFINKKAGDNLYKKVGPYFNASDLVEEVARVMKEEVVGY